MGLPLTLNSPTSQLSAVYLPVLVRLPANAAYRYVQSETVPLPCEGMRDFKRLCVRCVLQGIDQLLKVMLVADAIEGLL
jgi:hypothetical protein